MEDQPSSTETETPAIVTFGETMLRLSPPRGRRLEAAETLDFRTAGAESNTAIAASNLGCETAWLSKLPKSPLGRRVSRDIKANGVAPLITWDKTNRQGVYFLEHGSTPRGTNVIYDRSDAAITTAKPDELHTESIETASIFYVTGITPALSDQLRETTVELLTRALDAGTTTAFDLNYRSKLWSPDEARKTYERLFESIDVLFVPARDARTVLEIDGSPVEIATQLKEPYGCELVVVTNGAEGSIAADRTEVYEQQAYEVDTVDPIGTGDAFVGGFLTRWLESDDVESALNYAAATASLKRTIEGDLAILTRQEVEDVIASGSNGISR
jgi:2-dehydro-3-deoxygluconokinase